MNLLLIEPYDQLAEMISGMLVERFGAAVAQAKTGDSALELVRSLPELFCIITECHLPDMPVEQLLQALAAEKKRPPVIVCSSALKAARCAALQRLGVVAIVEKPNVLKPLLETLESLLHN